MDTSRISQFLSSLSSVGFFQRVFSWKKIVNEARMAQDTLGTLNIQYSQEFSQYQATIQRSEEEVRRTQANYQSVLNDKQTLENRLSQSEARERDALTKIETLREEKESVNAGLQFEQAGRLSLSNEHTKLTEKYDQLSAAYQAVQTEIASYKAKIENIDSVSGELERLKEEYGKLDDDYNAVKENLAVSQQKIEAEIEKECAYQKQIADITEERDSGKTYIQELQQQKSEAETKYNAVQQELAVLQTRIENELNRTATLQQDFDALMLSKQAEHDRLVEVESQLETATAASEELEQKFQISEKELQETHDALTKAQSDHENEIKNYTSLKTDYEAKLTELAEAKKRIAQDESIRDEQDAQYQRNITELNTLIGEQRNAKKELEEQQMQLLEQHNKLLATAWQRHEQAVEDHMHEIANKFDFSLCDKSTYPFPGVPDNAFLIGEMYTIFDAKSPKNPEDLGNFPTYLKAQAEKMNKYCKNDKVRKDAFLVVPSNTLEVLDTFMYPMADYTVYVITPEAVLPILQMLKLIESYDFADQLSPEDRASICQMIGRLSHTAKRKIQIDNYLSREMISVLQGIGSLPEDVEAEVNKYEKEAKLNPPMEKRAKVISISSISDDVDKIYNDTIGWSITEH